MARRWQRPGWFALALTLAGIAFFVRLGAWQVARAHEKERLFAAFSGATRQAPVSLAQARRDIDPARYPLARARGRYDAGHAWVLDNRSRDGRAGVMVFDLFEPADGGRPVLVNQGFLARDARGERPPIPPPPTGVQTLVALYAPPPGAGLRLGGNALPRQDSWPKVVIYLDLHEIAADLGRDLDDRVLLRMPAAGAAFVREWRPEVFPPERHYAYAFTWFTFAALCVVMFAALHWRKEDDPQ